MGYWVYLVRCGDNSLYTGATADLERRLHRHNTAQGAKYTAGRLPVSLVQAWEVETWSNALRLEILLKKCSKKLKEELILKPELIQMLADKHDLDCGIGIFVGERGENDANRPN